MTSGLGVMLTANERYGSELLEEVLALHDVGLNCAETVFWYLSRVWGLTQPISVVTGFGGGVARTGSVCGAALGAIAAIGARAARSEPGQEEIKLWCYSTGAQVLEHFMRKMGALNCRELLGFALCEQGAAERYAAEGHKRGVCRRAVLAAIDAALETVGPESSQTA